MRRIGQWTGLGLALAVMLGGCGTGQGAFSTEADSGTHAGGLFGAAWGGKRPTVLGNSLTIARVRGDTAYPAAPLLTEPGDVWPAEEAPRATLANPDAALRGIPDYQPNERRTLDRSTEPGPERSTSRGVPNQLRGGASAPLPPLEQPDLRQPAVTQPRVLPPPPPPPRADGQTILTPQGPVTTSGGTNRVQTYTVPGGGSGIIQRDDGFSTISPSGGMPQTFPTPR